MMMRNKDIANLNKTMINKIEQKDREIKDIKQKIEGDIMRLEDKIKLELGEIKIERREILGSIKNDSNSYKPYNNKIDNNINKPN